MPRNESSFFLCLIYTLYMDAEKESTITKTACLERVENEEIVLVKQIH